MSAAVVMLVVGVSAQNTTETPEQGVAGCALFCGSTYTNTDPVCGSDFSTYATACLACQAGANIDSLGKCTTISPTLSPTRSPTMSPTSSPTPTFCSQSQNAACFQEHDCDEVTRWSDCGNGVVTALNSLSPQMCGNFTDGLQLAVLGQPTASTHNPTDPNVYCNCLDLWPKNTPIDPLVCEPNTPTCLKPIYENLEICKIRSQKTFPKWIKSSRCTSHVKLSYMTSFGGCVLGTATSAIHNHFGSVAAKHFSYNVLTGMCEIHQFDSITDTCSAWDASTDGWNFFEVVDGTEYIVVDANNNKTAVSDLSIQPTCLYTQLRMQFLLDFDGSGTDELSLCRYMSDTEGCIKRDAVTNECTAVVDGLPYYLVPENGNIYRQVDEILPNDAKLEQIRQLSDRDPVNLFVLPEDCRGGSEWCGPRLAPTQAPTQSPTLSPTQTPTQSPTASPSCSDDDITTCALQDCCVVTDGVFVGQSVCKQTCCGVICP